MTRIYLSPPDVGPRERDYLLRAFDSGWVAPLGPEVDGFEAEVAAFVGVPHAVALNSGTAAIHLALKVLGVEPGDRVVTSTLTFVATANAITYCGATPVFIDSDRVSWNMNPQLLSEELEQSAQTGRLPAAVVVVDLFGQCADYDEIIGICQKYDVPVVEDAAEALGASYRGRPAGSFGDAGVFSFNGNKIMTTSGGGMLVTRTEKLAGRVKYLATQAREPVVHYEHREVGFNYRMSNLLAAVGRAQLEGLPEKISRRREIRQHYAESLGALPGVRVMPESSLGESNAWLSVFTIDPAVAPFSPKSAQQALHAHGIESRPIWKPMHMQPVFAGAERRGGTVSEELFAQGLCLPSGSSLRSEDQQEVIGILMDHAIREGE